MSVELLYYIMNNCGIFSKCFLNQEIKIPTRTTGNSEPKEKKQLEEIKKFFKRQIES